jgi:hypothetical protein
MTRAVSAKDERGDEDYDDVYENQRHDLLLLTEAADIKDRGQLGPHARE